MEAATTAPREEVETLRAALGELDEVWGNIYNIRSVLVAYADVEDSPYFDGALRELRNALDGITEAEAKLSSEMSSRRKQLGRL